MKEFISIFFTCTVICYVATFFFAGLFMNNIWAIVTLFAFILSIIITIFVKQESRIEKLEKKIDKLLKQQIE